MKYILQISLVFLVTSILFSQGENNWWYTSGGAGFDFSTSPPVFVTDGAMGDRTNGVCTVSHFIVIDQIQNMLREKWTGYEHIGFRSLYFSRSPKNYIHYFVIP